MAHSLRAALVPRSAAQWMALLGLIPFAAGAWIQARDQREIRIANMVVEQRMVALERRLDDLEGRAGSAGIRIRSAGAAKGTDSAVTSRGLDSLADGVMSLAQENDAIAREFAELTRAHEQLRARRGALTGASATANILLAVGALVTLAGVLIDIRQFRHQRRRAT